MVRAHRHQARLRRRDTVRGESVTGVVTVYTLPVLGVHTASGTESGKFL